MEKKLRRGQSWSTIVYYQMRKSLVGTKSCQNSILKAPIAWTYTRVDQIWSQIKTLVFLKIGDLGWVASSGGIHLTTLTYMHAAIHHIILHHHRIIIPTDCDHPRPMAPL